MKRTSILVGAAVFLGLALVLVLVVLRPDDDPDDVPNPEAKPSPPHAEPWTSEVTLVQANLKGSLSPAAFDRDLAQVVSAAPDFVTLNETGRRTTDQITPPGYQSHRAEGRYRGETPVLWRTEAWAPVADGTRLMHDRPVRWGTRWANWVTLRSTTEPVAVSLVSVHASPRGPGRAGLQERYVARLDRLVSRLSAHGPVLVGGDLNLHYPASPFLAEWLQGSGARSTFDVLGEPQGGWATGDRGGVIDYVLATPDADPLSHATADLAGSDHRMLAATLRLTAPEGSHWEGR